MMMALFLVKRLLIAIVTVYCDIMPVVQIATGIYITLVSSSFTLCVKPMESNYLNWVELANDFLFITTNYFSFLFTDYVVNPSTRYQIGNVYFQYLLTYLSAFFMFIIFIVVKTVITKYRIYAHEKKKKMIHEKNR